MLDELDALMERMLALPVSDLDDEVQMPIDAFKRTLVMQEEPESYQPEEAESPATIPFYRTEAEAEQQQLAPPMPVEWKLEPPPPLDEIAPPATDRAPLPELSDFPAPLFSMRRILMSPLWLLNGGYDAFTWWLGPLGRWLRGPGGRGIVGYMGLAFLVLSATWLALDWFGWTTWMGWNW